MHALCALKSRTRFDSRLAQDFSEVIGWTRSGLAALPAFELDFFVSYFVFANVLSDFGFGQGHWFRWFTNFPSQLADHGRFTQHGLESVDRIAAGGAGKKS